MCKIIFSVGLVVALAFSYPSDVFGIGKKKRLKMSKARNYRVTRSLSLAELTNSPSLISETIENRILEATPDIYPINVRFPSFPLFERDPLWDHREADRGAQRILAARSTLSIVNLVKGSELRDHFTSIEEGIKAATKFFTYSVQNTGSGYTISSENRGEDMLRFSLKFSLSRGADPLVSISDSCRLRYDISNSRTLLEYGFDF